MNKEDIEALREAIKTNTYFLPSDDLMEEILMHSSEGSARKNTAIVDTGDVDSNLYIICSGTARVAYFDGTKEVTFGFGQKGALYLSVSSFMTGTPAHFMLVACTKCTYLKMSRHNFEVLLANNHEFSRLIVMACLHQLYCIEVKQQVYAGSPKKGVSMITNKSDIEKWREFQIKRPDIVGVVSSKVIASCLGIIPSHLSNLRHDIIQEERSRSQKNDQETS
ncbi:MAG: cyclic nucleotide-binding domain-containing protein [Bacteroidales bacterium]|nr:cyclic nucleotide-binding domain-containing protein [Bacteroidales bacterium]